MLLWVKSNFWLCDLENWLRSPSFGLNLGPHKVHLVVLHLGNQKLLQVKEMHKWMDVQVDGRPDTQMKINSPWISLPISLCQLNRGKNVSIQIHVFKDHKQCCFFTLIPHARHARPLPRAPLGRCQHKSPMTMVKRSLHPRYPKLHTFYAGTEWVHHILL